MTYTPTIDMTVWQATRELVTSSVNECAGKTPYASKDLFQATTRLAAWVHTIAELELTPAAVFAPATIERFIAEGLPNYAPASRGNRRSMLLRMSEALLADDAARVRMAPLRPSSASAPYSKAEIAELRRWVLVSKGPRRNNATALIALGLGAGLSAGEILSVTHRDIQVTGSTTVVTVHGARSRTVLVNPAWARSLARAAKDAEPADWVFCNGRSTTGKNLLTNFIKKTPTNGLAPNSQRMRATWIVGQLQAGTAAVPLMRAAGVASLEAITRYVQFVDEAA